MHSYREVSGHNSQRSQKYEMTQSGHADPLYDRESRSTTSNYQRTNNDPPLESSSSSYERSTNAAVGSANKGVMSLSKAFENKSKGSESIVGYVGRSDQHHHQQQQQQHYQQAQQYDSAQWSTGSPHVREIIEHKTSTPLRIDMSSVVGSSQHQDQHHSYQQHQQQQQQQHNAAGTRQQQYTGTHHLQFDQHHQQTAAQQTAAGMHFPEQHTMSADVGGYTPHHDGAMHFHVPGSSAFDMSAVVRSPSSRSDRCQIVDMDDNNYSIRFVPREMGNHHVNVMHRGIDIPGSPFEFFVGPVAGGGATSIRAYGTGLYNGMSNERCQFEIVTKDAGAGSLSVSIEGPVKADIDFHDKKDGTCVVSYICPEAGDYRITIKFNDINVPGSPFVTAISSPYGERLMPKMHQDSSSRRYCMNEQMSFTVDMSGKRGRLEAFVRSPTGSEEECMLVEGANNSYSIRFTPKRSGLHWVHVRYNGKEIPDSPFQVHVNENISDPSKVFASGSGLYHGEVGSTCEFFIDTVSAGSGALSVTVDGPSKVDIVCNEVQNGYRASFIPTMPGNYGVIIKFADVQIAGSPFQCRVADSDAYSCKRPLYSAASVASDRYESASTLSHGGPTVYSQHCNIDAADRVKAYGTGLTRAFINQNSKFCVDTSESGQSVLTISLQGPKKPARDIEVCRSGADDVYDVSYCLSASGNYQLTVKWGDNHIQGSPFTVVAM